MDLRYHRIEILALLRELDGAGAGGVTLSEGEVIFGGIRPGAVFGTTGVVINFVVATVAMVLGGSADADF